ncbi:MAG: hypothetical protein HON94_09150 [Methylococcales bacterium]|jgi:hypothetical protein|nr:hypothetical protein [Methylococcales bacterium]MBT7409427.1 hypothetical protein [Methylococcales bacterium]
MSFFEGIPNQFHDALKSAIEAVNETNEMIRQVKTRFEIENLAELNQKKGESFGGYEINDQAIEEFDALLTEHESRRQACQSILDKAANV